MGSLSKWEALHDSAKLSSKAMTEEEFVRAACLIEWQASSELWQTFVTRIRPWFDAHKIPYESKYWYAEFQGKPSFDDWFDAHQDKSKYPWLFYSPMFEYLRATASREESTGRRKSKGE